MDELIARLRERAADPARRTTVRASELTAGMRTMDLGQLLGMARQVAQGLRGVVEANQQGRVDPAGHEQALGFERLMTTPAPSVLPAPASEPTIAAAEARLGVRLPPSLWRVYAEVADGGFGPGEGILPLTEVVRQYEELRSPGMMPRGRTWPDGLLPLVSMDPGWDCVEASTGRVIGWDPEELTERSSEDRFRRSFSELFPTVEAWLTDWLGARTAEEARADLWARMMSPANQVAQARQAREAIGRMTPEERAKMGLPAVGWERVVWGGIGLDDDEEPEPPASG